MVLSYMKYLPQKISATTPIIHWAVLNDGGASRCNLDVCAISDDIQQRNTSRQW